MTGKPRRDPNLTEKLASALLIIADLKGDGIPFDHAKQMTAEQICSLVQWDHENRYANGGSTHPTNITPRWILEHREKTAKIDVPQIYKGRRLEKAHAEFRNRLLAKTEATEAPADRPKRKYKWPKRKLESRSTFETGRNSGQ